MSEAVYLFLKIAGTEIQGESPVDSLGRANSIPCLSFDQSVVVAAAGGTRAYAPLTIRKRIDKSTPLIAKALTTNQPAEGRFLFFRPNPTGDGTTEQYFTVEIKQARIVSQHIVQAPLGDATTPRDPAVEEIAFAFQRIRWTYNNGGVEHEDSLPVRRGGGV